MSENTDKTDLGEHGGGRRGRGSKFAISLAIAGMLMLPGTAVSVSVFLRLHLPTDNAEFSLEACREHLWVPVALHAVWGGLVSGFALRCMFRDEWFGWRRLLFAYLFTQALLPTFAWLVFWPLGVIAAVIWWIHFAYFSMYVFPIGLFGLGALTIPTLMEFAADRRNRHGLV